MTIFVGTAFIGLGHTTSTLSIAHAERKMVATVLQVLLLMLMLMLMLMLVMMLVLVLMLMLLLTMFGCVMKSSMKNSYVYIVFHQN